MKKYGKITLSAVLALFAIAGCVSAPAISAEVSGKTAYFSEEILLSGATPSSEETTGLTASSDSEISENIDTSVTKRDVSGAYDTSEATTISTDGDLTITEAGVYVLSGRYEGMVVIDAGEEDKVQLVLENATITNVDGPAIYVRSADKVFITAAEETVNTISDGTSYDLTDGETALDAAVFSKDDLTINGSGTLTINGNYKHAIVSKDDLIITAKNLSVNAENVGLNGKDSVKLSGATVSISAGSDGIRSENGSEPGKGFVAVVDSKLEIVSDKDGIQAETVFLAENAEISITAGGGSSAWNNDTLESFKGIKAGVSVNINGGAFRVEAIDDAIHTNGSVLIQDGEFTIQSRDDGIHANEKVEISGGNVNITAREGIEGTYILISDGEIAITASDDGINAAYKSSAYKPSVEITGGLISITMGAGDTDCIDSNGNLIITGGTLCLNGQSPFDYDGSATFTGGTLYVNGQEIDTIYNQMMGGFGGKEGFGEFPGGMGGFGGEPGSQGGFDGAHGGHGGGGGPSGRP